MNNIWYDKINPHASFAYRTTIWLHVISFGLLAPISLDFRSTQEVRFPRLFSNLLILVILFFQELRDEPLQQKYVLISKIFPSYS